MVCGFWQCKLAVLTRSDYLEVSERVERAVYKALATDSDDRTDKQVELLFEFFEDEAFFFHLQLDGMRRQCCRAFVMQVPYLSLTRRPLALSLARHRPSRSS